MIADDEPLLREILRARLAVAWPELQIVAEARNGREAVELARQQGPDICFLDVHMPGVDGIEAARQIGKAAHLVFVTAYEQYALQAFEAGVLDYLVKPVVPARLAETVVRLRERLQQPVQHSDALLQQLAQQLLRAQGRGPEPLRWLRATVGPALRLIPVDAIDYLKADSKYTLVAWRDEGQLAEALIRLPLKELQAQLDAQQFVQVHRAVVVNLQAVQRVVRGDNETADIHLKSRPETLPVSRSYLHLFARCERLGLSPAGPTLGAMHVLATASPPWTVHLKLLGMAALWGGAWPAGRVAAQALPALSASAWRFAIATLMLAAWWLARGGLREARSLSRKQWLGLLLGGAIGVFGYAAFFLLGLQHVPAGRAALVVTTNPVLTMLLAAWLFGERLNRMIGLGMALAVGGALLVLTKGAPWTLFSGGLGIGELLLLGCVLCWSGYTLLGRKLLGGLNALTATTVTAAFGLPMLIAASWGLEGSAALAAPLQASGAVWAALLFMAVGSTVLAYAWYFEGVAALGAGGASAYISLVPVFGVLFATLLLGEALDGSLLVGGALVIAGMVVMNQARR